MTATIFAEEIDRFYNNDNASRWLQAVMTTF
jgi:hypothetical protein